MSSSKYIVRQPIKDQANKIIGYEIRTMGKTRPLATTAKTSGRTTLPQRTPFTISSP